jgi:hypothetical protein
MQPGISSSLGILSVIAALGSACTANGGDESILVLKNVQPGAGCMVMPSETETGVSRGALDVQFKTGYEFFAQVKSRITATTTQVDQRVILTRGANVDITFADSTVFSAAELTDLNTKNLLHFLTPFSVPIPPNDAIVDVEFELIPVDLVAVIAAKKLPMVAVQTTFKMVGDLSGGNVSSQPFSYSIQVVSQGFRRDQGLCADLSTTFVPKVGNSCNPGQDGVVDCCKDPTGEFVCPAVGTKM